MSFKVGDWVRLKRQGKQIKTLLFGKRYMVHGPQTREMRRLNLQNETGEVISYFAGFFELAPPVEEWPPPGYEVDTSGMSLIKTGEK